MDSNAYETPKSPITAGVARYKDLQKEIVAILLKTVVDQNALTTIERDGLSPSDPPLMSYGNVLI